MTTNAPWGYHLLLDCKRGDKEKIQDKEVISSFVKELVNKIDMVPYGELMIERFATHDEEKAGISFCQMIETSNITGHFVEKTGDFYLDVFSCKEFEIETVMNCAMNYFLPEEVTKLFVSRG